jgi:hypothetical protein
LNGVVRQPKSGERLAEAVVCAVGVTGVEGAESLESIETVGVESAVGVVRR